MPILLDLYEAHRDSLYSYACGLTGDTFLAEDMLQDVFISLMTHKPSYTGPQLKSYIYSSLRHRVIDHFRRKAKTQSVFQMHEALRPTETAPADEQMARQETQTQLESQLAELKTETQEIIYLHLHGDLTFAEIADVLEQPQGTIASKYRRGLQRLKERLADLYQDS